MEDAMTGGGRDWKRGSGLRRGLEEEVNERRGWKRRRMEKEEETGGGADWKMRR